MKLCQLIEYNKRNIFPQKICSERGREAGRQIQGTVQGSDVQKTEKLN